MESTSGIEPTKKQWKPRACCMDDTTDDTIIDVQIDDKDDLDGLMRALDEPVPPKKKKVKPRPPTEPPLPDPEPSSPSVEDALMRALVGLIAKAFREGDEKAAETARAPRPAPPATVPGIPLSLLSPSPSCP